ncbi:uncharacterized protein TNCV_4830501 [Trichonephila clavipes]|nr:uncharacterized protein TNCV_4830501 [Trichonephila clavipes]
MAEALKVLAIAPSETILSSRLKSQAGSRESSQLEVSLALKEQTKSIISTYNDKCTAVTQKDKSLGKSWEILATAGLIPRHLERAEAVSSSHLTTGDDFLGAFLHWLRLTADEASSLCGHVRIATTCSNALDSMNTRLTTSSVSTGRLGVKWSEAKHERWINKYVF